MVNFVYSNECGGRRGDPDWHGGHESETPLKVNFTDYQYLGHRGRSAGGSSRACGSHRLSAGSSASTVHQDIAGTFVGVPSSVTPGLAEEDGKFFEKSWAFSLGPTGGVLIGIGPFEVMAETQLRFLGGLSDVDWLVEEGLRDVNSRELALVGAIALRKRASGSRGLIAACSRGRPLQSKSAAAEAER